MAEDKNVALKTSTEQKAIVIAKVAEIYKDPKDLVKIGLIMNGEKVKISETSGGYSHIERGWVLSITLK
jgi:hypothetical protein